MIARALTSRPGGCGVVLVGWLSSIGNGALGAFTLPPPPVLEPTPRPVQYPDAITKAIAEARAARWIAAEAESIPGVRKALAVIVGTISTLTLSAWKSDVRQDPSLYPWLGQPDPTRTSQALLAATIRDGIWTDRATWRRVPGGFYRLSPDRVVAVPDEDPDKAPTWTVDGRTVAPEELVTFDFAGMGGLRRFGAPLLELFTTLMVATARYADEPVPSIILKNTGADIPNEDIDALVDRWEAARAARRTGFLNAYLEAITPGYSARDLQLVEVTEAVTKDVARLFGLPGWTLGVDEGSSMTYANVVDRRRDVLDALRPWSAPVEQTLSLDAYAVTLTPTGATAARRGLYVPYGTDVRFDTVDYLRDPFAARVTALVAAAGGPIMSPGEARTLEPTITDPTNTGDLRDASPPAAPASPAGP